LFWSGAARQRSGVEDRRTAATATEAAARRTRTDGDGHGAGFSVSDTLRDGEDATVNDDHDNQR